MYRNLAEIQRALFVSNVPPEGELPHWGERPWWPDQVLMDETNTWWRDLLDVRDWPYSFGQQDAIDQLGDPDLWTRRQALGQHWRHRETVALVSWDERELLVFLEGYLWRVSRELWARVEVNWDEVGPGVVCPFCGYRNIEGAWSVKQPHCAHAVGSQDIVNGGWYWFRDELEREAREFYERCEDPDDDGAILDHLGEFEIIAVDSTHSFQVSVKGRRTSAIAFADEESLARLRAARAARAPREE